MEQTECQTCKCQAAASCPACHSTPLQIYSLHTALVRMRQEPHLGKARRVAIHVLLKSLHLGLRAIADLRPLVVLGDLHIQAAHAEAVAAAEAARLLHLRCQRQKLGA